MAAGTRDRILDTALSQFVARGIDGVTVIDLEHGAGLSPGSGSFYRHFRSKDDVLAAVVDREIDRAASRRESEPVGGALEDHYVWALDNLHRMRSLIALLVKDGARLPHLDRIRTVLAEGGSKIDAVDLADRMSRGEIPVRDADAVAAVVLFAVVGHHLAERFFGGTFGVDRDRFAAALASLVSS